MPSDTSLIIPNKLIYLQSQRKFRIQSSRQQFFIHFFFSSNTFDFSFSGFLKSEIKNSMGSAVSRLTQYDIEDVQEHCNYLFSQQEIVSLYERFRQLDRNANGFISADEFLSVPEFAVNPLSHRLLKAMDGINFKDFVEFLSVFSAKASMLHKIEFIFKIYDSDGNGEVTFAEMLEMLLDLAGSFVSPIQREEVLTQVLQEAGYEKESILRLDDFIKILGKSELKMDVEIPVD